MTWSRSAATLTALSLLLALAAPADARRRAPEPPDDGLPAPEAVAEQVRAVYADLSGSADPAVRRVVYFGSLELGEDDVRAAIEKGMADADPEIRRDALTRALTTRDRKMKALRAQAEKTLTGLLESADEADRALGYALLDATAPKERDRIKTLERTAKDGSPDARKEARARLIALGGKTAWKVISQGLAQPEGDAENTQARETLETWREPEAMKWAFDTLHQMNDMGRLARAYLIGASGKKLDRDIDRELGKRYDKATEFEDRLRLAYVRAHRGQATEVTRTLLAGLRYKEPWAKLMAWHGLQASRDHATLGKLREQILLLLDPEPTEAAFGWLEQWAAQTGDPKVIEVLQQAARGDRPEPRAKALAALTAIKHRDSIAIFEGALGEGRTETRLAGAKGLAAIAKPGDEQRLAEYLRRETDADVKLALVEGLANIGTPAILDSLQFVVTDRDPRLKTAAAKAIAKTSHPRAVSTISLLKRDPDLDTRFMIWRHLLTTEGAKVEPEFKAGALGWLTPDHVRTLGEDGKTSNDLLTWMALDGNDDQRPIALTALRARGAAAAPFLLRIFERSRDPAIAAAALDGILELRGVESLATYRGALENEQPAVRAVAFRAVGDHARRAYLEMLLKALADRDPLARAEAARAAYRVSQRPDEVTEEE